MPSELIIKDDDKLYELSKVNGALQISIILSGIGWREVKFYFNHEETAKFFSEGKEYLDALVQEVVSGSEKFNDRFLSN